MVLAQAFVVALAGLVSGTAAQACATVEPAFAPTFGAGFSGRVILNDLSAPRGLIIDSLNNLLVVEQGSGGVRYITLTDNGGTDLCVASEKKLIEASSVS